MPLALFFWVLAAVLAYGRLSDGGVGWLLVGGAAALVALVVTILAIVRRMVERSPRR
jgi:hypothetical protein